MLACFRGLAAYSQSRSAVLNARFYVQQITVGEELPHLKAATIANYEPIVVQSFRSYTPATLLIAR